MYCVSQYIVSISTISRILKRFCFKLNSPSMCSYNNITPIAKPSIIWESEQLLLIDSSSSRYPRLRLQIFIDHLFVAVRPATHPYAIYFNLNIPRFPNPIFNNLVCVLAYERGHLDWSWKLDLPFQMVKNKSTTHRFVCWNRRKCLLFRRSSCRLCHLWSEHMNHDGHGIGCRI